VRIEAVLWETGGSVRNHFLPALIFLGVLVFQGCETADSECCRLSRQQALTIESLNSEIVRLNREIEGSSLARTESRDAGVFESRG